MTHKNPADWNSFTVETEDITFGGALPLFTFSTDTRLDSELVLFRFSYTCDVTVANRYFRLYAGVAPEEITLALTTTPLTALTGGDITFGIGHAHAAVVPGIYLTAPLPQRLRITANSTLILQVINTGAGDILADGRATWNHQLVSLI